jgi:phosphotriesterase-related protein
MSMHSTSEPFVSTVLGPIAPEALGVTLMHEHLLTDVARALTASLQGIEDRAEVLAMIEQQLRAVEGVGVATFVDVSTQQFGASPLLMRAAAARTAVHIVCAVGCFPLDMMPAPAWAYPPATLGDIEERLWELATHGVGGSGVRPGILKLGTGRGAISEIEEMMFRAAAAVQRRTGLGITTHTTMTMLAEEQSDLLIDAGADVRRCVIGHIGWGTGRDDLARHVAIAERGVTLGLDMVGLGERSVDEFVDLAADLIHAGYAEQLILAHDSTAVSRGLAEIFQETFVPGDPTTIHRELLPKLRERGVDEATIHQILVENPRRILTIDPALYPDTELNQPTAAPSATVPFATA